MVGLVVGINQFTFAFGPSLVGIVRDWAGAYRPALGACTVVMANAVVNPGAINFGAVAQGQSSAGQVVTITGVDYAQGS